MMKPLQLVDLMRLVATDEEPHKVIEKAYEWQHARWLEVGKWFLATGTAGLIGLATLVAKPEQPLIIVEYVVSAASILSISIGMAAFWRARFIAARYARVRAITGELSEVRQFLQLLRKRGKL